MNEIAINVHNNGEKYVSPSKYAHDNRSWQLHPHWKPTLTVKNRKERLVLEFIALDDKSFEAKIIVGPPDLLGVKTPVDWKVLAHACLTGDNVVGTGPLQIEGDFIWKTKGSVKLCSA